MPLVTASSFDDAVGLLLTEYFEPLDKPLPSVQRMIENVDLTTLEPHGDYVRDHMHPPNWRGVWYPRLNSLR